MIKKIDLLLEKMLDWLAKRNWHVISGIAIFLALFELFELVHKNEPLTDPFHSIELFIYIIILALVGIMINFLREANDAQNRMMEILNYKHNISMELTKLEDWEELTSELARLPSTIVAVDVSQLYVHNPISDEWEAVSCWKAEGVETINFLSDCQKCLKERNKSETLFSPCLCDSTVSDVADQPREYCLPLNYADSPLALIQFKLKEGSSLTNLQAEIFESIRYEMALALKASQEQQMLSEMQLTRVALAERHSLSTYLHDNLSQNLAYLCLKLDQFIAGDELVSTLDAQTELKRMKEAANQSYDIVRGTIESIHPETTPHFVNLIRSFAKKVSQRSGIAISIDITGKDVPLDPQVQQTIFYVFQEVLSNAEKHAQAEEVKILIDWGKDQLAVTVSDNGIGFNPKNVDRSKHFGMNIMQERIGRIKSRIDIRSSYDTGTEVTLYVPIPLLQMEE